MGSYSSAEMQSVYSTGPADWAETKVDMENSSYLKIIECLSSIASGKMNHLEIQT